MSAVDTKGDEKYWINGITFEGLRFSPTNTGSVKYWFEGMAEENLTPRQNFDTGKMFLTFE